MRRLILVFVLLPVVALAQTPSQVWPSNGTLVPDILRNTDVATPVPGTAQACKFVTSLRINKDTKLSGPISLGITDGRAALVIGAGVEIPGPLAVTICDNHVTIQKE